MNLIDTVSAEIASDDADTDDQSARLVKLYQRSDPITQSVLDEAFICLCGWGLGTLIERSRL